MSRISSTTKIRLFAAIVPVVMLVGAPFLALAFSRLGKLPASMRDNGIASLRCAAGLDSALYKMESGRSNSDGTGTVIEQQQRFAKLLDAAAQAASTNDQRRSIDKLAAASRPIFDSLRASDPSDSIAPGMQQLHIMVANLVSADQAALASLSRRTQSRAHDFAMLTLVIALLLPWICFAATIGTSGRMHTELHEIRRRLANLNRRPEARNESSQREIQAIDAALTRLGFPVAKATSADD